MIGDELRALRIQRGLSLRDLALISGISSSAIGAIEQGRNYPSLDTLECLAEMLRVRIVIGPDETTLEPE